MSAALTQTDALAALRAALGGHRWAYPTTGRRVDASRIEFDLRYSVARRPEEAYRFSVFRTDLGAIQTLQLTHAKP